MGGDDTSPVGEGVGFTVGRGVGVGVALDEGVGVDSGVGVAVGDGVGVTPGDGEQSLPYPLPTPPELPGSPDGKGVCDPPWSQIAGGPDGSPLACADDCGSPATIARRAARITTPIIPMPICLPMVTLDSPLQRSQPSR